MQEGYCEFEVSSLKYPVCWGHCTSRQPFYTDRETEAKGENFLQNQRGKKRRVSPTPQNLAQNLWGICEDLSIPNITAQGHGCGRCGG